MDKDIDLKRKSRNLSEKKRRDQFNNLINELGNLIDPHFNLRFHGDCVEDNDEGNHSKDAPSTQLGCQSKIRKMDKSSVLKSAMEFLKKHPSQHPDSHHQQQQQHQHSTNTLSDEFGMDKKFLSDEACQSKGPDTSNWKPPYITDDEFSIQMLEALDAFIVVCEVDAEARVIYSSDTFTNLLDYSGTCNSLRGSDFVSLFDLVAPNDKKQIEQIFSARIDKAPSNSDTKCIEDGSLIRNTAKSSSTSNVHKQPTLDETERQATRDLLRQAYACVNEQIRASQVDSLCRDLPPLNNIDEDDCLPLTVNFRLGLNLNEIKQKRSREKTGAALRLTAQQNQHDRSDSPPPVIRETNILDQQQQKQPQPLNAKVDLSNDTTTEKSQIVIQTANLDQQNAHTDLNINLQELYMNDKSNKTEDKISGETDGSNCRGQRSIAEKQQHLMSVNHKEQQDHNQQQQEQRKQEEKIRHEVEMMHVDCNKSSSDDNQSPADPSNNGNTSDDTSPQQTSNSGSNNETNSDENDQPSSTGSDDASDSSQLSHAFCVPEKRHHYRHHGHNNHSHRHHNQNTNHHTRHHQHTQSGTRKHPSAQIQRRLKLANGLQYELVRLTGTFKGFGDDRMRHEDEGQDRYKFEEPPPKRIYFVCIGKLDIPRFSYDLKIIMPPVTGGINLFHNNQFISKHTLKWRFLWIDNRAPSIIGYLPFEVLGTSGYDYYHWDDLDKLVISHEGLMRDGEASSGPYRFLTKGQQWIWLQTKFNIILKSQPPEEYRRRQKRSMSQTAFQQNKKISTCSLGDASAGSQYTPELGDKFTLNSRMCEKVTSNFGYQPTDGYKNQPESKYEHQMFTFSNPLEDGPLQATGNHGVGQDNHCDDGSIVYTVSAGGAQLSGPKRFRAESTKPSTDQQLDRLDNQHLNDIRPQSKIDDIKKLINATDRASSPLKLIQPSVIGFDENDHIANNDTTSASIKQNIERQHLHQQAQTSNDQVQELQNRSSSIPQADMIDEEEE